METHVWDIAEAMVFPQLKRFLRNQKHNFYTWLKKWGAKDSEEDV